VFLVDALVAGDERRKAEKEKSVKRVSKDFSNPGSTGDQLEGVNREVVDTREVAHKKLDELVFGK
jgi:hypothetical protein